MTSVPDPSVERRRRRFRWYIRAILVAYPFGMAAGFFVGYNAGSHLTHSTMLVHGLVGLFVGFLVVVVVLHLIAIIVGASTLRARTTARQKEPSGDADR